MNTIDNNQVQQILIVVKDIEKRAKRFAELFGLKVPPTTVLEPEEIAHAVYRGKNSKSRPKMAVFHMGSADVEFLQPDSEPSLWSEFLGKNGEGISHLGFTVKNLDETVTLLSSKGFAVAYRASFTGGRVAIMDTWAELGINLMIKQLDAK